MYSLWIVQRNSTRRDHPRNPGRVTGSSLVSLVSELSKSICELGVHMRINMSNNKDR